ncbi:hypothetical protein, partial [Morganella morganii]|uniref:hypothetical protein n=1 Tax=Morganella morganii TaxID=582 RepID=UPI003751D0C8
MTAIVFPHVCCNGGIITDLCGYGCIPGNLGLGELHSHFIVTDKESRMLSTNQKLAVLAHDNKTSGAWDD